MEFEKPLFAFWYGSLSAVSLPLGALLELWLRPSGKWTSSLMAFGAGAVEVDSGRDKRKVAELGAGESFGEMALISGDPRSARVSAVKDVSGWTIAREDFDRLLGENPGLKQEVSRLYVNSLAH